MANSVAKYRYKVAKLLKTAEKISGDKCPERNQKNKVQFVQSHASSLQFLGSEKYGTVTAVRCSQAKKEPNYHFSPPQMRFYISICASVKWKKRTNFLFPLIGLIPLPRSPRDNISLFPYVKRLLPFPPFPFLLLFASEEEVRQLFASKDEKVNFRRKGEETTTSSVKYRLE